MTKTPAPSAWRYFGTKRIQSSSPVPITKIATSRITILRLSPKKSARDCKLLTREFCRNSSALFKQWWSPHFVSGCPAAHPGETDGDALYCTVIVARVTPVPRFSIILAEFALRRRPLYPPKEGVSGGQRDPS